VANLALAEKPITPETTDGVITVGADWLKSNISTVKVYDVRKKGEYVENHIPGATNVPYKEKSAKNVDFDSSLDKFKISKLPADKNTPVVVYCNGIKCWKSYKSAVTLAKAGYTKVHWLRGGFPEWQKQGYPVE